MAYASASVILWRRLDQPGLEHCELRKTAAGHRLTGTAVGVGLGKRYRADYIVDCDTRWRSRDAWVSVSIDGVTREIELRVRAEGGWNLSGQPAPHLEGCVDIDLAFTPATNTVALRRLDLPVGASGKSRAVWILFPDLTASALEQRYLRQSKDTYRYEAHFGEPFTTALKVNEAGLVSSYPPFWREVS